MHRAAVNCLTCKYSFNRLTILAVRNVCPHGLNHGQGRTWIFKFTDVHPHGLNHGQGQC